MDSPETHRPPIKRTYGKKRPYPSSSSSHSIPPSNAYNLAPRPYSTASSPPSTSSWRGQDAIPGLERSENIDTDRSSIGVPSSPMAGAESDALKVKEMIENEEDHKEDDLVLKKAVIPHGSRNGLSKNKTMTKTATKSKQITLNTFFHRQSPTTPSYAQPSTSSSSSPITSRPILPLRSTTPLTSALSAVPHKSQKPLTQLHLIPIRLHSSTSSSSIPRHRYTTCSICSMSYIPSPLGGEDGKIHEKHCERVKCGVVWNSGLGSGSGWRSGGGGGGKEKKRDLGRVVESDVRVSRSREGREGGAGADIVEGNVIAVKGTDMFENGSGAGTSKLQDILSSVDLVLSSPALPINTLRTCTIYLFTTSSSAPGPSNPSCSASKKLKPEEFKALLKVQANKTKPLNYKSKSNGSSRNGDGKERVVGVLVVQPIKTAMRVLSREEMKALRDGFGEKDGIDHAKGVDDEARAGMKRKREMVVACDERPEGDPDSGAGGAVICDPERLPTRLGVHRIFTISGYRGLGISKVLLDAACEYTLHGYKCDPHLGEVAFSQPTSSGKAVMDAWGGGAVRVFVEDEQE